MSENCYNPDTEVVGATSPLYLIVSLDPNYNLLNTDVKAFFLAGGRVEGSGRGPADGGGAHRAGAGGRHHRLQIRYKNLISPIDQPNTIVF